MSAPRGRALLGSLEPGTTYRYRVTARRGPSLVTTFGTFTTRPFPEWTVGAVVDSTLHVDGQPFFPRMVYGQCDWAYQQSLDAGVNLYMGSGCSTPWVQLDALRARAVSAIPAAWKDVADGRGSIGWYHPDEADLYMRPEALPFHPPWQQSHRVTFLTLSGHVYSGSAGPPYGRSVYPGFIARADMIGLDLYPMQVWCRRDAFRAVYEAQRELAALAGPRATYQWIEVGRMEFCKGRPELDPTPLSVRAETWLAVAGGARGIGYFPDHWRPDITSAIASLNTQISALAPALLAEEAPGGGVPRPRAGRRAPLQRRAVRDRRQHVVAAPARERLNPRPARNGVGVRRESKRARPRRRDHRSLRAARGARLRRRAVDRREPPRDVDVAEHVGRVHASDRSSRFAGASGGTDRTPSRSSRQRTAAPR